MKKYLIGSLTVLTVMWAMGLSLLVAAPASAAVGDLVKSASSPTVYVVGADGVTIMPFPHANVYSSWGYPADFSTVMTKDLSSYTVGPNVEFRSGSLVKGDGPAVYYIENRTKRPIISDVVFLALGWDWDDITWLSDSFLNDYPTGAVIDSSASHPDGSLVKYAGSPAVYLIDGGKKRPFASAAAFEANRYNWADVITIPDTETYPDGTPITGYEQALSLPQGVGSTSQTGSGLTVSVSPMNPAATTVIADSTTNVGQSLVPFLAVNFTASSDGDVKVTSLRFKRKGISADSDILNTYLYDSSMNRLALGGSLSSNYLTFNDPNGLFTVPAGSTYTVYLRVDLNNNVAAGKTIGFDLESASDVTTDGAAVSGSFPVSGNLMTTAQTNDLGYASLSNVSPTGNSNVDPGQTNFEVWRFTVMAGNQDIEVRKMKFTNVGSIQKDDLQNFYLYVNGVEVAGPMQMNDDREVVFDLSSSPYSITKGTTKTFSLRADIVKGSSRTFRFSFQYQDDVVVWDANYGVYTQPYTGTTWSIVQAGGTYTINSGSLTVTRASDSPTGNVAQDATNVHLARFNFEASGEDIKISNLRIAVDTPNTGVDNGKVFVNGVQVGPTTDFSEYNTFTTINFGSSFIAKAGETTVVDIYGDIKQADGSQMSTGNLTVYLGVGSSNGQGMNSLTTLNVPSSQLTGNTLQVTAGSLSVNSNAAYGNQTMVAGTQDAKVGSFVLTAGSAEGVNVNSITVSLSSAEAATTTNLKLMKDGSQLGTTISNPSTSNLFSGFSFDIPASGSVVVDIYADLKSGADSGPWTAEIPTNGVSGTGLITGNSVTAPSSAVTLQTITIGTGSLTATLDASAPDSDIILAGASKVHMNAVKFTALYEDFEVQEITFVVDDTTNDKDNVAKVIIEYPTQGGGTGTAEGYLANGSITFTGLNMFVPRNDSAVMNVYIDLPTITSGADSGDEFSIDFDVNGTYKHQGLGSGTVSTSGSSVSSSDVEGNDMVVRKTRPTITLASLPTTTLQNGNNYILKFTVAADSAEDVAWSRVGLDLSLSGVTYTTAYIYDYSDLGTALSTSSTATSTSGITFDLSTEEVVPAGGSKTYIVKINVAGVGSGDSVVASLKSPYTTTATGTWNAVAANENAFVWSDNSALSHSFTSSDWCNAEYVKTLPSDTQTLYRS